MTVLHLISSEGCYGAESMMLTLSSALARQGHDPIVGLFQHDAPGHLATAQQARLRGLRVESVSCRGRWDSGVRNRIRQITRRCGVRVLHAHGYKADVYAYAASEWPRRTTL